MPKALHLTIEQYGSGQHVTVAVIKGASKHTIYYYYLLLHVFLMSLALMPKEIGAVESGKGLVYLPVFIDDTPPVDLCWVRSKDHFHALSAQGIKYSLPIRTSIFWPSTWLKKVLNGPQHSVEGRRLVAKLPGPHSADSVMRFGVVCQGQKMIKGTSRRMDLPGVKRRRQSHQVGEFRLGDVVSRDPRLASRLPSKAAHCLNSFKGFGAGLGVFPEYLPKNFTQEVDVFAKLGVRGARRKQGCHDTSSPRCSR